MRLTLATIFLLLSFAVTTNAATLESIATFADGLDMSSDTNVQDDYVRLTLLSPSYQQANAIKVAVEEWLGPDMVILESATSILVQAPRDSSKRVQFLAALSLLEINIE